MSFQSILERIRKDSLSEQEKGARFEKLIKAWFRVNSLYNCKDIWLWEEFPSKKEFGGNDLGIDLVLRNSAGEYWAIQCKFYSEDTTISKQSVDSFIANSNRTFTDPITKQENISFSSRVWISTTEKWGKNALESVSNQAIPFIRVGLETLESFSTDWDSLLEEKEQVKISKQLLPHQVEALSKAHEYFKTHERGKMIMACGTGKTFTSLSLIEQETQGKGLVLFLVPSIALLNQSLIAWSMNAKHEISPICICSDNKASKKVVNKIVDDEIKTETIDLALPATTNTDSIIKRFEKSLNEEKLIVIFSTYQSIEAIAEAQQAIIEKFGDKGIFDWIVCDEAHRTTGIKISGQDESSFVKVHNNDFIQGKHRLYMTATPRLYSDNIKVKAAETNNELCSMDDENLYGQEFYRVGFSYAVEHGLLTDYKVFVLTVNQDTDIPEAIREQIADPDKKELDYNLASKLIGCINGLSKNIIGDNEITWKADPCMMKRGLVFCANIDKKNDTLSSKNTAKMLPVLSEMYFESLSTEQKAHTVKIKADHIDGSMDSQTRTNKLSWLKGETLEDNECRLLSNVRCLSEGIDVPALDAVIFLSSRNSQVDVVQSVGRVMRNFRKGEPGEKKYGYIIIPVVVSQAVPVEEALKDNEKFGVVWSILNALRSHDDRFNATVNKISLNKTKPENIVVTTIPTAEGANDIRGLENSTNISNADDVDDTVAKVTNHIIEQGTLLDSIKNAIYARLVEKVGDRTYWEKWAKDIGLIAREFISRITSLVEKSGKHQDEFNDFVKALKATINNTISKEQVIEMLAQHLITKPVFDALFQNYQFATNNTVCSSMEKMISVLVQAGFEKDTAKLQDFYSSVKTNVGDIDNLKGKQEIIKNLYEKFFKGAFPKTVDQLGIVYTPIECVDFILYSVNDILKQEFNTSISDENVHVLDPFTGTETFITRLLQHSDLIKDEDLERKYLKEIHCNEIVLLAYYVADVNIESVYHDRKQSTEYQRFDNICLTDTFELSQSKANFLYHSFEENSQAVQKQQKLPIRVIVGNPPYSVGQKAANDNAQNAKYEALDKRIEDTYAKLSTSTLKNSLYDTYIKAFRWASDRLANSKEGGIIAFISNGSWLNGNAQEGMRKCLEQEFTDIYILNLRGDCRTQGELRKKEGDGIFGLGSRTPVSLTFLVKNPQKQAKAKIHYFDIGDYLKREEKLEKLYKIKSIHSKAIKWQEIIPNEKGDWIKQRDNYFDELFPLIPNNKFDLQSKSFFITYSCGLKTNRDSWCYNSNKEELTHNMQKTIAFYNSEVKRYHEAKKDNPNIEVKDFIEYNSTKFSWDRVQKENDLPKEKYYSFDNNSIMLATYRPFYKQYVYANRKLNNCVYQLPQLFPTNSHKNLVICTSSIGDKKDFTCIITDCIPDLHIIETTQCFPLYWYEERENTQASLLTLDNNQTYIQHDGISNWILKEVRSRFGNARSITKEQIFYYVYGILHNKQYRERFKNHLKKSLPKIPIVDNVETFIDFYTKGKQLAELHLNYEEVPAYPDVNVVNKKATNPNYEITKMRFAQKNDKSTIIYNDFINIENIPSKTYEYIVNGKSAIEWVMDRYQISTHKESNITNNPNDWANEQNKPSYILDLLLSIITVSIKSVDIINSLPVLNFDTESPEKE